MMVAEVDLGALASHLVNSRSSLMAQPAAPVEETMTTRTE